MVNSGAMYKLTLITMHKKKSSRLDHNFCLWWLLSLQVFSRWIDKQKTRRDMSCDNSDIAWPKRVYRYKVRVIDSFFTEIEPKLEPGSRECICRHVSNVYTYIHYGRKKRRSATKNNSINNRLVCVCSLLPQRKGKGTEPKAPQLVFILIWFFPLVPKMEFDLLLIL